MNKNQNVAIFVGSLRKDSLNRKLAKALIAIAPESLSLEIVEISNLPFYNQDFEENPPKEVREFRQRVKSADAVLFLTPEYNRSVPAVLKNAIDVGSRPYMQNAWNGKPGAAISVSQGALGAFGANHHLRQSLVFINVPTMAQPEAYIGNAASLFDDKGQLVNDSTKDFLQKFLQAFARWIDHNSAR
jgi:chromate reductase